MRQAPDGTQQKFTRLGPPCSGYGSDDKAKDDACRRVPNVVEATTPDQLLHRIEQTLPNVDRVLESVRDLSEDVRRIVNGPLQSVATRVDGLVQREAGTVKPGGSSGDCASDLIVMIELAELRAAALRLLRLASQRRFGDAKDRRGRRVDAIEAVHGWHERALCVPDRS